MDSPQSTGLPRAYEVRSQRERVLEAVVRVAAAKGYEATTVTDVIEYAGVSRATYEEMFDGKEDCFLEAYEAVFDVLIAHVTAGFESAAGDDARERYRGALARFTPFLERGRTYSGQGEDLPADTARFAVGGATSMIFDEVRAGRGPELKRILPDLVFAVLMPYLGPEAAEDEMRRVTRQG